MSDTPRTDAAARAGAYHSDADYSDVCDKQIVRISFARRLERELNAAHADGAKLSEALRTMTTALDEAKAQRDAALDELDKTAVALTKVEALLDVIEREFIHAK